jgi:D-arabinose 5-phosphate isomerase GutQ
MDAQVNVENDPAGARGGTIPGDDALLAEAQRSLAATASALGALQGQLGAEFLQAVHLVLGCGGHVAVSGAGTSEAVAVRMAHLLTVVGAPAFAISPGEALHGGAGAITARDVLIAISKGGESDELNALVGVAREVGAPVIALTQSSSGTLARISSHPVVFGVPDDLDAAGSIALGSSLAAAAVGDALCHAVFLARGFDERWFARIHPGGAVGKALNTPSASASTGSDA